MKLKAVEAQREQDFKNLKSSSSSKVKGMQMTQTLTATIVSIAKSAVNQVDKPNSTMKKTIEVNSTDVKNTHLSSQVNQVVVSKGVQTVLNNSVKAEVENGKVVVNTKIAESNNLQLAVTRGLVNAYNTMPGYGS
jgi:hypothetical protein